MSQETIMELGLVHESDQMLMPAKPPSLFDLCVQKAIDNVGHLGDVGDTDIHLLERVLPHCTAQQLMHVEIESQGIDLSQVTDKLWRKHYEARFDPEDTDGVVESMNTSKRKFLWRILYQEKVQILEDLQKESLARFTQALARLTQAYKKEEERKQSRQIHILDKVPSSGRKRRFYGGHGGGNDLNVKSKIMKKAVKEHHISIEFKNHIAMKRKGMSKIEIIAAASNPGSSSNKPHFYRRCKRGSTESFKPCVYPNRPGNFQLMRLLKLAREEDELRNPGPI